MLHRAVACDIQFVELSELTNILRPRKWPYMVELCIEVAG